MHARTHPGDESARYAVMRAHTHTRALTEGDILSEMNRYTRGWREEGGGGARLVVLHIAVGARRAETYTTPRDFATVPRCDTT